MGSPDAEISQKYIARLWAPLALTWLMMAVEGPFIAALIARLRMPEFNLAAFGVALSFALLIEAPVIMMMSASTALADSWDALCRLRRFNHLLNLSITLIMLVGILPDVFFFFTGRILGLPPAVATLTHMSTMLFLPWPAAIGIRRFYQGLLIRRGRTRRVTAGTAIRISVMAITAWILFRLDIPGACLGAAALSAGVTAEAIAVRLMAKPLVADIRREKDTETSDGSPLTLRSILRFYYPLALTSILALGIHPVVTLFMARGKFPVESLAVMPVVNSLVFIFRSIGLSFQEVVLSLLGRNRKTYASLRRFARMLGLALFFALGGVAFTPLLRIWMESLSGLSPQLSGFATWPARVLSIMPALTVWISFQRAVLMNSRRTVPIIRATLLEFLTLLFVLAIAVAGFFWVGAYAAACAYIIARIAANLYLHGAQRHP